MAYEYVVISGEKLCQTDDVVLPVNESGEVTEARRLMRDSGIDELPIYELPASPEDGGDFSDARKTSGNLLVR